MPAMNDPFAILREQVVQRVLDGPGASASAIRHAAFDGTGAPADLQPVIEKVHRHAYKVTDADISRLTSAHSDDELFELVVSASLGAAHSRLTAALSALEQA
jgi:hypothetical protein